MPKRWPSGIPGDQLRLDNRGQARHSAEVKIALATCITYPNLSVSDGLLATALTKRGHQVSAGPWNGPDESFTSQDMVVLRSNWDYHSHVEAFLAWLAELSGAGVQVVNDVDLVRWNIDKRYLLELGAKAVPIPAIAPFDPINVDTDVNADVDAVVNADRIRSWLHDIGRDRAVLKPAWGASGHLVETVAIDDPPSVIEQLSERSDGRAFIAQEFVPEIDGGEHALVFFGGRHSHAFLRVPQAGEFRVNSGHGGRVEPVEADPALIRFGHQVLEALPGPPVYARIDCLLTADGPVLMEVELNEPSLCLDLSPGAGDRFAEAIFAR